MRSPGSASPPAQHAEERRGRAGQRALDHGTCHGEDLEAWLEDYSLFAALKHKYEEDAWYEWPTDYRDREEAALNELRREMSERIEMAKFFQLLC